MMEVFMPGSSVAARWSAGETSVSPGQCFLFHPQTTHSHLERPYVLISLSALLGSSLLQMGWFCLSTAR